MYHSHSLSIKIIGDWKIDSDKILLWELFYTLKGFLLLTVKLYHAYVVLLSSCQLQAYHLKQHKQWVKMGKCLTIWAELYQGEQ